MFFSRIKKDLILLSGIICLLSLAVSCDPVSRHDHLHRTSRINSWGGQKSDREYSVLVLHSYNDMGQESSYFKNYMDRCFRRHGMNVHADHICLDLIHKETPFVTDVDIYDLVASQIFGVTPVIFLKTLLNADASGNPHAAAMSDCLALRL